MALEGNLQGLSLARVLRFVTATRKTGILTVQGEEDIVAVSLLDGRIVGADALNQTAEEGLGEVLLSRNLISAENLAAVAVTPQGASGNLGDLLVERGFLSRDQLLASLRVQIYRQMLRLLTWREGEYKFYGGDEVSYEEGFSPLPIEELIVRAVPELGDAGGFSAPLPDLEEAFERVPTNEPVRVLGRDGDGDGGGLWISQAEEALLAESDGATTAAAAARALGLDSHQALHAVYHLLENGLVESVGMLQAPLPAADPIIAPEPQVELNAEIFTPPEPAARPPAHWTTRQPRIASGLTRQWVGTALGLAVAAGLLVGLFSQPKALLLPFPWQGDERVAFEDHLRQSLFQKIDRAAEGYYLARLRYPGALEELVDIGLLSPADLTDPSGSELSFSSDDASYRLEPLADDEATEDLGTTRSIHGDLFLDPHFLKQPSFSGPPLYLID